MKHILLIVSIFISLNVFSQTKPTNCNEIKYIQVSAKPSFSNMLKGVRYAVIVNKPKINGHVPAFKALINYLKGMGFESIEYLGDNYVLPSNLCQEILVELTFNYQVGVSFYNIKLTFFNPHAGYKWELTTSKRVSDGLYSNPENKFGKVFRDMYGYTKGYFNSSYTIKLPKMLTCWNEFKIKQDFKNNGLDKIEGIYENTTTLNGKEAKYKVAVKNISNKYYLIYLSGANNPGNWEEGEVKAILEPTATPNFYKATWIMANKSPNNDFYISFEQGLMNVISADSKKSLYIKLFPSSSENITTYSNTPSSGTGFAITSNGIIATNYHVIEGAKTIKVRGVNSDFNKTYNAKVLVSDKNNDLALIQIDDHSFTLLGTIPYTLKTKLSNVGESIFALGYPLRAVMGDEIKLTNGIISSKTGFQGDITSYQVSAPVQPGNSGGPLFDSNGNVIGIINAKLTIAENASYAVKASYLMNLFDLLNSPPKLPIYNSLKGKSLAEQVQLIKKFVYIIETE